MLQAFCSRRVAPDTGGAQEALGAYEHGDYGAAAQLLRSSMWSAESAEERTIILNNYGCTQARPLAGRPATVEVCRLHSIC